jgi:hypothetical protein
MQRVTSGQRQPDHRRFESCFITAEHERQKQPDTSSGNTKGFQGTPGRGVDKPLVQDPECDILPQIIDNGAAS